MVKLTKRLAATKHSTRIYIDGLVQDCSISSANALEVLQSCAKPAILSYPLDYKEPCIKHEKVGTVG